MLILKLFVIKKMSHVTNYCSTEEFAASLDLLKRDLTSERFIRSHFTTKCKLPILYNTQLYKFKGLKGNHKGDKVFREDGLNYQAKIYAALVSCNSYMNASINECKIFDTRYFDYESEVTIQTSVFSGSLNESFEMFLTKAWENFACIFSFCASAIRLSDAASFQESNEVMKALQVSLESYESAIYCDFSIAGK
ncbi:hypothetical protein Bhyg_15732 [Pseudolycoriella hygida]|uniref:Uncharacterized protein n=1 Tax=Pseudolycoriella hygida TaxID=35572 RepID=A0A9Q0MJU8_9DIPT|nr:hypothetical protein Bhyg_15732 [Pseudolycoriella hygida]